MVEASRKTNQELFSSFFFFLEYIYPPKKCMYIRFDWVDSNFDFILILFHFHFVSIIFLIFFSLRLDWCIFFVRRF